MTEHPPTASETDPERRHASLPEGLPEGSAIVQVTFVTERHPGQEVLFEFPPAIHRSAVRVSHDPEPKHPVPSDDLLILTVPTTHEGGEDPDAETRLAKVQAWVDARPADTALTPQMRMMTLQGVRILWGRGRFAVLARDDRLVAACRALIETAFYEGVLRDIEHALGEGWPELEADLPLAFEFDTGSMSERKRLRQRYQEVLLLRAKLARIAPYVHLPHLYPPSLASQVGERLRERTRVLHRYEMLSEQIGVFEDVYETCGQRASDFMLTRSGNTLEWVIIVLLLTQVLLWGFELLTTMGT